MIRQTRTDWTANRTLALILGIVFVILGVVGFFTPQENSTGVQALFGIFDVDTVQNVFHLITGLIGLAAAFTGQSINFNRVFGVVYTLIGLLGLIPALYFPTYGTDSGRFLGLTHLSIGDHILNIVLGVIALAIAFYADRAMRRPAAL
ncbi:MAG: DUF4383 domain-containing protein [Ktedonobacteraceae bacterium]